jgi:hypothetical protein
VETFTEVVADASGLVQAEASLARAETAANMKALGVNAGLLAAGAMLLMLAIVFVTVAGVVALAALVGLGWALLIVAALCVLGGGLLVGSGRARLGAQKLLPERSLRRMSADLRSISNRSAPVTPQMAREPAAQEFGNETA